MGMTKLSSAQIVGKAFTCLARRMSSPALNVEGAFSISPGKIEERWMPSQGKPAILLG